MHSIRAHLLLAFVASVAAGGACSDAATTAPPENGGPAEDAGATGPGSDAASPPKGDDAASKGDDASVTPPASDASNVQDAASGDDEGSVSPPPDAPDDAPAPVDDAPSPPPPPPWYDAGVTLGCAANPNPPDPTIGWTEFADPFPPPAGATYPQLEYPYNLGPQDACSTTLPITDMSSPCRFNEQNGVLTFWIFQTDQSHLPPDSGIATTDPRSEMHWSTFMASDPHPQRMWTGDVVVLGTGNGALPAHNCILQVHTNATGQGPVYLRIDGGKLLQLGGPTYYTPTAGTWFNLKVAFDAKTLASTVWVNNCQVGTWNGSSFTTGSLPGGDVFYFKNGSYGCTSGECIDKFANIKFYVK